MCWVKKSRDTETSTRRSEVIDVTATRHTGEIFRFGSGLTMATKRNILNLQQRVDVLNTLDAGHSCRAVAVEVVCGKMQIS